jgi:hypothetical protein
MKRSSLFTIAISIVLLASIYSCTPKSGVLSNYDPYDTQELLELMTGSFSSSAQAGADTSYYNISLHMIPIWPNEEADYLYVEQAVATTPTRPYRQRVYKLEKLAEGSYSSSVYTLANDSLFIAKWKKPEFFENYAPSSLIKREGCAVYLYRNSDGSYTGSTKDQDCESTMRGASYATSVVDIRSDQISSWDQGFDVEGKQVWGAENGPYIFKRKQDRVLRSNGAPQLQKMAK